LLGINDHQVIAGYDGSGQTVNGVLHPNKGFTLTLPTTFTSENYPNSVQTQVIAINNRGDTAGFYTDQAGATHGFLERDGTFTTVDLPGTTFNQVLGLNNRGQAAGYFQDAQGQNHAWIREPRGAFLVPPIPNSQATGINDHGVVVGFTQPTTDTSNAFILRGDDLTILSYPGATFTQALGANNEGQVVGTYNDAKGNMHGFVYDHATFHSVDVPGATATVINGIDNAGHIVGFFMDVAGNTVGVVGTPTTAQVVTLVASLQGANEVPGPGSPNGGGTALLTLDPSRNQVCYSLAVAGLAGTVSMAHIHQGAAGLSGPVAVQFLPPTQGSVSGCVTVTQDLLANLPRHPAGFYVNVHTTPDFPAGAARGQLSVAASATTT
jgi:probable HAF family extracellular repeat protein